MIRHRITNSIHLDTNSDKVASVRNATTRWLELERDIVRSGYLPRGSFGPHPTDRSIENAWQVKKWLELTHGSAVNELFRTSQ
jgi:hypothetical protein